MTRPKNKEQQALLQNLVWNEILVSEVVDVPYGVHAKEAAGQHQWGGQPHKPEELSTQWTFFRTKIA
jgi:hypothetical protein